MARSLAQTISGNLEGSASAGGKTAVAAGNDVFFAHHLSIAHQTLCHQLRMLDEVGGRVQHAIGASAEGTGSAGDDSKTQGQVIGHPNTAGARDLQR
jgi:hypothetical protein